jgi:hypothetical protein
VSPVAKRDVRRRAIETNGRHDRGIDAHGDRALRPSSDIPDVELPAKCLGKLSVEA